MSESQLSPTESTRALQNLVDKDPEVWQRTIPRPGELP
jgi:hypothetical protein